MKFIFYSMRVVRHWEWLSGEVVETLSLEMSKIFTTQGHEQNNPRLMCLKQETGADYLRTFMILQLSINSKPKTSSENTRIVSFLFNTLWEAKVHNSGIHGWIKSNREKLEESSNWIQFRQCLIQGNLLLNPRAVLCFSVFCCILFCSPFCKKRWR